MNDAVLDLDSNPERYWEIQWLISKANEEGKGSQSGSAAWCGRFHAMKYWLEIELIDEQKAIMKELK